MIVKIYGNSPESEKRYSPAVCLGIEKTEIRGLPDPKHISTSYIERSNLTLRDAESTLHASDQRFLKEAGESSAHACDHRVLQFC